MKVLCIRFSALGDVVLTTGVLSWMKTQFPDMEIDFVTQEGLVPLLSDEPYLGQVHGLPKSAPKDVVSTLAQKLPEYDFVLDWQDSLRSRQLCGLVQGKKFRIRKQSLLRRLFVRFRLGKDKLQHHVVEKYAQVGERAFQLPKASMEDLRPRLGPKAEAPLSENQLRRAIVVHPFASQNNKVWPYFKDLCESLLERGEDVILVGHTADSTAQFPSGCHNLINTTALPNLCQVLTNAKALVTTDSGPLHLGVATQCPTLAIFGPTTKEFGFYPAFQKTKVIENVGLSCRPCHVHGGQTCPKTHFRCMKEISTEQVLTRLDDLLQG